MTIAPGGASARGPGADRVGKGRIGGFSDTPLAAILRTLGVRTVLLAGVDADPCVRHSPTDAHVLGSGFAIASGALLDGRKGLPR